MCVAEMSSYTIVYLIHSLQAVVLAPLSAVFCRFQSLRNATSISPALSPFLKVNLANGRDFEQTRGATHTVYTNTVGPNEL